MLRRSCTLILYVLVCGIALAQNEAYMTWDEFVQQLATEGLQNGELFIYSQGGVAADDATSLSALPEEDLFSVQRLEELHLSPLDINSVTRQDLMTLPFITETQADSLIAYRDRHRSIKDLGELQLVSGWDYKTRRKASLFLVCPTAIRGLERATRRHPRDKWIDGVWQADTRLDVPLYTRQGYKTVPTAKSGRPSDNYFVGSPLSSVVRLRYDYHRQLRYGLTLHKDAGEAFATSKSPLYDMQSAYLAYKSPDDTRLILLGDYRLNIGQGLIAGNTFMLSRQALVGGDNATAGLWRNRTAITPHTSALAVNTLRGAAASFDLLHDDIYLRHLSVTAFASYRYLDARIQGDSVTTIHTSGYHRTPREYLDRDNLACVTGGARVQYEVRGRCLFALNGIYSHYDKPIAPEPKPYNAYYLRGTQAAAVSTDYYFASNPFDTPLLGVAILRGQGEVALDRQGHPATTNTLQLRTDRLSLTLQLRAFHHKYVTPMGQTLMSGSALQNEQAFLFGLGTRLWRGSSVSAYFDCAHHSHATYYATLPSTAYEWGARLEQEAGRDWMLRIIYKAKVQAKNIPAAIRQKYLPRRQENVELHRLALTADCGRTLSPHRTLQLHAEYGAALYQRQTSASPSLGYTILLRASYRASRRLTVSAAAAYFDTDDYNSRIYATMPMLSGTASFSYFAYQGYAIVALAEHSITSWLRVGAKINMLQYLDRNTISSGIMKIDDNNKTDLTFTLRIRFDRTRGRL